MSIKYRTFSNDLKAKDLCYSDDFFKLKSQKVIPAESFSFDSYQALKNVNDFKTNNYSNLFLLRKRKNSDWLEANVKQGDEIMDLATTISWYANNTNDQNQLGSWLYFSKNYEMFDINVTTEECSVTYGKTQGNYSNYIFYIDFIDQNTCRISHTFGDLHFYLVVEDDKTIQFSKNIDGKKEIFIYNLDGNILKLYKKVQHKKYDSRDIVIGTYERLYLLGIERDTITKQATLSLKQNLSDDSFNSLIYVNDNQLMFDFFLDGSWVSYNTRQSLTSIDRNRSVFELETQALIHHEYNRDEGMNFIPLKNNLTYRGNSIRGNNTNNSSINYPDVDYRIYNTIQSGTNQEKGSQNITLTFTFVDQEYELEQGDDLLFTIPQKSLQESNMLQPLWPYKHINLNDTKFIKNGAFGSNVPFFSDKIKKLQNHKSKVVDSITNEKLLPNNKTYLCSWLYKSNHQAQPIWLDRYYYPDMISKEKALVGKVDQSGLDIFSENFENIIDKNYKNDEVRNKIHQSTYFDKKSDLMIQAGNTYRFQRISNDTIKEILASISDRRVFFSRNQNNKQVYLNEELHFNNEDYRKISYADLKKTNVFTLNTDIYLEREKRIGIQLFGTDYNSGFNIQNRKDLAPFHYIASDKVLYMMNNKGQIIHQFDFHQKYDDYILKIILGDLFDDVIILSGIYLYILSYDLMLKSRIDLTAQENERQSIKNLEDVVIFQYGEKSLINYPYGHVGKKLEKTDSLTNKTKEVKLNTSGSVSFNYPASSSSKKMKGKLIASTKRIVYETIPVSGYVKIPSYLSDLIAKHNSLIYRNNLYVPIKQNIMKIIMCPDAERDFEVFSEKDKENFPACARILENDEFFLNYHKTNNTDFDTETLSVEQGFIEVQNIIKHIHIDKQGNIYGLNFDQYGVAADGDTIYGMYGWDKYIDVGGWWWLFNQSLSKMRSDISSSKYAQFASPNSIDMVKFNEKGEMCLIRNFNNIADNTNEDNNKRIDIYDKTKKRVYTFDMSSYDKVFTLDAYNYINEAHQEETCFSAICQSYGMLYEVRYLSNAKKITTRKIEGITKLANNFVETLNTNAILRYNDYNTLYFNLHIPSNYTYDYLATIKWNLDDIQNGWYNINVVVDLDKGVFELRINDELYERINQSTHSWFRPYQSSNGNVFRTNYYIGTLGKKYGTTLNKMLKNSVFDPYTCQNAIISNMKIFTKNLEYYEYLAMRMEDSKVNKLILTLPCGNRSNIEQIIRYFKYNASPAISNKVKINISGTGLSTSGQFEMLRKEIMAVLEDNIDCMTNIKEISFIQNQ